MGGGDFRRYNSTEAQEMSVSPEGYGCKRVLNNAASSYCIKVWCSSVTDYGLGLTTVAQTDRSANAERDRVQTEAMRVTGPTGNHHGSVESMRSMPLDLPPVSR